ncbi:hypothetical protein SCUCBS95973_009656 [Sporothrix curviconia]|uniref:Secreted protein n=1 Tax=Sporothrix curviconia TaxID=1260050 RepID=A0ABP0CXQ9_9PEZI
MAKGSKALHPAALVPVVVFGTPGAAEPPSARPCSSASAMRAFARRCADYADFWPSLVFVRPVNLTALEKRLRARRTMTPYL